MRYVCDDKVEMERYVYQELFQHVLLEHPVMEDVYNKYEKFENNTFIYRPYYWGDDEEEMDKPNFEHKPSGYKIWWYKYPLRGAEANMELTTEEFASVLYDCRESLDERDDRRVITYDIGNTKWWAEETVKEDDEYLGAADMNANDEENSDSCESLEDICRKVYQEFRTEKT